MRQLYSLILYCLSPLILLRLLWRSSRNPAYRRRLAERFGWGLAAPAQPVIWLHSVSVGETLAAVPLVHWLLDNFPQYRLLITTTTPTGSARVTQTFGDSVLHVYAPYDLPGAVLRFLRCFRPQAAIIMETEIWPNLFHACRQHHVGLILANARMSEKSAQGYRKFAQLTRSTLRCIDTIACQTEADRLRFVGLGADEAQLTVTGSIKFDLQLPADLQQNAAALRRELGQQRPVWIAASTHEGEDEVILDAYQRVQGSVHDLLLVLVPRHPERFDRVAALCAKRSLDCVRRSSATSCPAASQVYLGDTMGELLLLYAAADVAFVGGSLVAVGGHNLLEPAALGLATITGPYMHNFEEITAQLLACHAIIQVADSRQLAEAVRTLLDDSAARHQLGEHARQFVENNRGALGRMQGLVSAMLSKQQQPAKTQ